MKLKKALCLLLAAGMAASMMACGNSGTSTDTAATGTEAASGDTAAASGEMVTVRCAFPSFTDTTDSELVEAEINKVLAEKYNIQCDLTFIGIGSWTQQSNLLLTGDEVDVICLYGQSLAAYVTNGQIADLTDYVANASEEMQNKFTQEQWDGCKIDGKQYAVPNLRNYGNIFICFFNDEMFYGMGYTDEDLAEIDTLDEIEEVLYKAHEAYPDVYTVVPQSQKTFCNGVYWDGLGDQIYIGVLGNCGQDTTVTDIFECEDFINFCKYTHKWYQDGLMMGDALSNQNTGSTMIQNDQAFASFSNRACEPCPQGMVQAQFVDAWSDATNITALTYGINNMSSQKDAAWTMMEALYCDTDVQTLLIDGIEGTHYLVNDDGTISYPEGVTSSTSTYGEQSMYWSLPYANADVPVITDLGPATFFSDLIDFNNSCTPSIATGITIDYTAMGVVDQYSACSAVKDNYYDALMNGILDPETDMAAAHQAMVDAGINDIIAAKQAALDEFLANK